MAFSRLANHASSSRQRYLSPLLCFCAYSNASQLSRNFPRLPQFLRQSRSAGRVAFAPPNFGWNTYRPRSRDVTRCWMGSKVGGPPGELTVEDYQNSLKDIDLEKLKVTIGKIRTWLGYESYDITVVLLDDEDMAEQNHNLRDVDGPTDIISTPLLEAIEPGRLHEPDFDFPPYFSLGDIFIDVPYVIRMCEEDQEESDDSDMPAGDDEDSDDDGYEYDDRGVSAAMAKVTNPELRIHMLLVHGMLHLVGHDHVKDDDYEIMVNKEEALLKHLGFPTATDPLLSEK